MLLLLSLKSSFLYKDTPCKFLLTASCLMVDVTPPGRMWNFFPSQQIFSFIVTRFIIIKENITWIRIAEHSRHSYRICCL